MCGILQDDPDPLPLSQNPNYRPVNYRPCGPNPNLPQRAAFPPRNIRDAALRRQRDDDGEANRTSRLPDNGDGWQGQYEQYVRPEPRETPSRNDRGAPLNRSDQPWSGSLDRQSPPRQAPFRAQDERPATGPASSVDGTPSRQSPQSLRSEAEASQRRDNDTSDGASRDGPPSPQSSHQSSQSQKEGSQRRKKKHRNRENESSRSESKRSSGGRNQTHLVAVDGAVGWPGPQHRLAQAVAEVVKAVEAKVVLPKAVVVKQPVMLAIASPDLIAPTLGRQVAKHLPMPISCP
ncbi:hypothetical protein LTR09_000970 [Extremus antarcticus]|uniref:Uncharacterized protein n=1 Tax=Extremus antarcticus TaxID=702011 RepID=A0AAJ0GI25_9PEZI|nr:hypothetical protein LTR09_000970 [Extremus antarcticus]